MGKMLIGNFKGPKGNTGEPGTDGRRGSRWTQGTAVTGTDTTPAVFSGTGIGDALVDDVYMNTNTGNIYRCTLGGDAQTAKWAYTGSIKGPVGATGAPGRDGATGAVDANTQIEFADIDTYVPMQSGNSIATLFSKIKKGLADLFSGMALKLDASKIIASRNITEPGFLMDGKTASEAFAELYSKKLVYDDMNAGDITIGANGYSGNLPKPNNKTYIAATVLAWQSNNSMYGIAGPNHTGNFQALGIANSQIVGLEVRFWRYSE